MTENRGVVPPKILEDLADFRKWRASGKNWTLFEYAALNMTVDLAIAITEFLFPNFREIDGYVVLAPGETDTSLRYAISQWEKQLGGDASAVERALNHYHLCDLIPCFHEASQQTIIYFGNFLVRCWSYQLKQQFPDRCIVIEGRWGDEDHDFVITLYQERGN